MELKKRLIVMVLVAVLFGVCFAATAPGNEYKNLKVLPKNISSKKLQQIMIDDFEDGLGVNCGFCHAEKKGSHSLDYTSDEKPEKEIARSMMRMEIRMNKKYFHLKKPIVGDSLLVVTCNTCHRGSAKTRF